jgi:hypothetical protein
MTPTPAELFRHHPAPEEFARAVRGLGGEFPFDAEAMIALGRAYFERHPDSAGDRDLDAVRIGYAVVRACSIETIVRGLNPAGRDFYRAVFEQPSRTRALVEARISDGGEAPERLRAELEAVRAAMEAIRAEIELIPKGMIKERFVGGISLLSNGLYLVKTWLERVASAPLEK